jgi:hypothetical protein
MVDAHWKQQYTKYGTYEQEIARGNVRGAYPVSAYGKLIASSSSTRTLVQTQDGTTLHVPQSVQMALVSSSVNDTDGGSGVRTVVVEYLNGDLDYSFELVTLNGTTPVNMLATDVRWVYAVHMATAGNGGVAAGSITVTNGGNTYAQMTAGQRSSHSSFYRVPRNKTLYVSSMYGGSSSGTAATSVLLEFCTSQIDGLNQQETGLVYSQAGIALQDNSTTLSLNVPLPVAAGHIAGFIATCDKGATITAGFIGWVE